MCVIILLLLYKQLKFHLLLHSVTLGFMYADDDVDSGTGERFIVIIGVRLRQCHAVRK